MYNQLFRRRPTENELYIILKCYGISNLDSNENITYLSLQINNTINKLYENLDILIDVYLPCKYKFISELTIKRCITILRQITRLYNYKVVKYSFNKASIYKIESNSKKNILIKKNVELKFN
jgi:hypothetical protein